MRKTIITVEGIFPSLVKVLSCSVLSFLFFSCSVLWHSVPRLSVITILVLILLRSIVSSTLCARTPFHSVFTSPVLTLCARTVPLSVY